MDCIFKAFGLTLLCACALQVVAEECTADVATYEPLIRSGSAYNVSCYASDKVLSAIGSDQSIIVDLRLPSDRSMYRIPGSVELQAESFPAFIRSVSVSGNVIAVGHYSGRSIESFVCNSNEKNLVVAPHGIRSILQYGEGSAVLLSENIISPYDFQSLLVGNDGLDTFKVYLITDGKISKSQYVGDIYSVIEREGRAITDIVKPGLDIYVFSSLEFPLWAKDLALLKSTPNLYYYSDGLDSLMAELSSVRKPIFSGVSHKIRGCNQ